MASRLLAFLLVLALWPALGETVELGVHLVTHGDLAHDTADDHGDTPLGTDEHGCSGTFHLCAAGHPSALLASRVSGAVNLPPHGTAPRLAAPLDARGRGAPTPPIRPPIA